MTTEMIVNLDKIRRQDFWNRNEIAASERWKPEEKEFIASNKEAMNDTSDTYKWVKENFGKEMSPFEIFCHNCAVDGIEVTDSERERYERIYGTI